MDYPSGFPGRSPQRELVYVGIAFNAAAAPALLEDLSHVLDATTPITDLGAGQYRLNFRKDAVYPRVYATANLRDPAAAADRAFVQAVTVSADGRQLQVQVNTAVGGAIADPATAKRVDVILLLGMV